MKVEQIYTGCLAQGAYMISCNGEVAIIDPLREVAPYIEKANAIDGTIKYIFETHFHADFVSGHLTLAEKTGAPIIYGPLANPSFDALIATDGQEFPLGDCTIKVLHTPGHTMESTTYLLQDASGSPHAIFSGDTLFLGDVGRPDLAQKAADMTQEDLAGMLYDSLRAKIMTLPDEVIVYPAHGAGSACGKNMSTDTVDTLGNQKRMNYALRADMSKEEFISEVTDGLLPPPKYFPLNVKLNKEGYQSIDTVVAQGTRALSPEEFEQLAEQHQAIVLDVRHQADFIEKHIPRSIFIGLNGSFAPWVGALIADISLPILLVVDPGKEEEAVTRLSRVGFDNTLGYLNGGVVAWEASGRATDDMRSVSAADLKTAIENGAKVYDVRKESEYETAHLPEVALTPLDFISDHYQAFPKEGDFYVHCAGGYRSVIAASILKRRGYHNVIDVAGGFAAIKKEGLEIVS
ncbi:MBL fold metallo-hydrolase [Gilvibacter sediminis]|uniref:MBL fold metallo-hydrolase n=1 Tax=Gilvibacter sediminis TaxID=379071 RepID=UPI002350CAD5|nr:rhodanese-like domain-containing protein [Gilvibacter sediminis]MDC7997475.1 rhodanese-like domain-containing protein [Gilvibacter sediminis]